MPTELADGLALAESERFQQITAGFAPNLGPPLPGLAARELGTTYQHKLVGKVAGVGPQAQGLVSAEPD